MRSSRVVVHSPARLVRSALIVRSAINVLRRPKFADGRDAVDTSPYAF